MRKVTWYNPPFNIEVKTNIGKQFLRAIKMEFHPKHKLHKLFNNNTVKLSYSCMDNMQDNINKHNRKLIRTHMEQNDYTRKSCNCRRAAECPLDGDCMARNIVYQATISTDNSKETYIGLTATNFKSRLYNHKASFSKQSLKNSTELSKHVWRLKETNTPYTINWKIVRKANAYSNTNKNTNNCVCGRSFIFYTTLTCLA